MVFAVVVTLKSSRSEGFVDFSYFSSLTFWTSKITWFMPEYLYFKTLINKDPFFFFCLQCLQYANYWQLIFRSTDSSTSILRISSLSFVIHLKDSCQRFRIDSGIGEILNYIILSFLHCAWSRSSSYICRIWAEYSFSEISVTAAESDTDWDGSALISGRLSRRYGNYFYGLVLLLAGKCRL